MRGSHNVEQGSLHCNLDLARLGLLDLRKHQFQHAVLVGRADAVGIHGLRQGKAAREDPERAFETVGVSLFSSEKERVSVSAGKASAVST